MPAPLTLDDIADRVRRKLSRVPAIDNINLPPEMRISGDPDPNDAKFSNPLIYQMVEETISELNVECGLTGGSAPDAIPISGQTALGPYRIDLATAFGPREQEVNTVNRVWWNDGTFNTVLTPTSYRQLDADLEDFYSITPSIPQEFWISGYVMWVQPAPVADGTLFLLTSKAMHGPVNRRDTIANLPADLHTVVVDGTALKICAAQPNDRVLDAAAAVIGPMWEKGVVRIKSLLGRMNSEYQGGLVLTDDYRVRRSYR